MREKYYFLIKSCASRTDSSRPDSYRELSGRELSVRDGKKLGNAMQTIPNQTAWSLCATRNLESKFQKL
jgi:hypothetical protein